VYIEFFYSALIYGNIEIDRRPSYFKTKSILPSAAPPNNQPNKTFFHSVCGRNKIRRAKLSSITKRQNVLGH
jgi:hypothetical protein